jgi:hypothetical protein
MYKTFIVIIQKHFFDLILSHINSWLHGDQAMWFIPHYCRYNKIGDIKDSKKNKLDKFNFICNSISIFLTVQNEGIFKMKFNLCKLTVLFLIGSCLFTSESSFAENLICFGGIQQYPYASSVELSSQTQSNSTWSGNLKMNLETLEFTVNNAGTHYNYKIKNLDTGDLYLNEDVLKLPAVRTLQINNKKLFIDCRPYSIGEYCRTHTC